MVTRAGIETWWQLRRTRGSSVVILSLLGLLLGSYQAHLFQMYLLPRLAPVAAARSETLALPIRIHIIVGSLIGDWILLVVPACVIAGLWVGLFWKPDEPHGPTLLLAVCIVMLLLIQSVFLVALFQAAEYLPAAG